MSRNYEHATSTDDPSFAGRPSFLDSYALVSGQLNPRVKSIKNERTPSFKRYICLPLTLSQDRDEDLARSTEGRIGQGGYLFNARVTPVQSPHLHCSTMILDIYI